MQICFGVIQYRNFFNFLKSGSWEKCFSFSGFAKPNCEPPDEIGELIRQIPDEVLNSNVKTEPNLPDFHIKSEPHSTDLDIKPESQSTDFQIKSESLSTDFHIKSEPLDTDLKIKADPDVVESSQMRGEEENFNKNEVKLSTKRPLFSGTYKIDFI